MVDKRGMKAGILDAEDAKVSQRAQKKTKRRYQKDIKIDAQKRKI
jgi:hypothetical protein